MKSTVMLSVIVSSVAMSDVSPAQGLRFEVIDLTEIGTPRDINDSGDVLFESDDGSLFVVRDNEMVLLDTTGVDYASATDINNLGQVVGTVRIDGMKTPAVWNRNGHLVWTGSEFVQDGYAIGISETGIVTGSMRFGLSQYCTFWTDGTSFECWDHGTPNSADAQGRVLGDAWEDGDYFGAIMTPDSVTLLPGEGAGEAFQRNSVGEVVGRANVDRDWNWTLPVLWHGGKILGLAIPPDSGLGTAFAINDRRWIVGSGMRYSGGNLFYTAFFWKSGVTHRLQDLVDAPMPSLSAPLNINSDGQILVLSEDSDADSFLLVPVDGGLTISEFMPSRGGTINRLIVNGATPGHRIRIYVGRGDTPTDVDGCPDLRVHLKVKHVLGDFVADVDGTVVVHGYVREQFAGMMFSVQAVDMDDCVKSPAAYVLINKP